MTVQDLYAFATFVPAFRHHRRRVRRTQPGPYRAAADWCGQTYRTGPAPRVVDVILPERLPGRRAPACVRSRGYWRSGEKINYRFVAAPVLAAGGIAALVEYNLMPRSRLVRAGGSGSAIGALLQAHASDFGAASCATDRQRSFGRRASCFLPRSNRSRGNLPALPAGAFKACCF